MRNFIDFTQHLLEKKKDPMDRETKRDPEEIRSTDQYDKFHSMPGNRGESRLSKKNVELLVESIQRNNRLRFNPIFVNRDFMILKGHHRLEAARQLNVPIWYQIVDMSVEDVIQEEKATSSWTVTDILGCRAANGCIECSKLLSIIKNAGVSLSMAAAVCGKITGRDIYPSIRKGDLIVDRELPDLTNRLEKCQKILNILRQYFPVGGHIESVMRGIAKIVVRKEVNFQHLLEKTDKYPSEISFYSGAKFVYKDLVKIYNRGRKEGKISV